MAITNSSSLNPTQLHLLRLFSKNSSEDYAREIKSVLMWHFQQQLNAEDDRLWDSGVLSQEKLDQLRHTDLHKK